MLNLLFVVGTANALAAALIDLLSHPGHQFRALRLAIGLSVLAGTALAAVCLIEGDYIAFSIIVGLVATVELVGGNALIRQTS